MQWSARQTTRRRTFRGRTVVVLGCLLMSAVADIQPAQALDPTRRLMQCLHRIWQLQQGLPQATIYSIRRRTMVICGWGRPTGLCDSTACGSPCSANWGHLAGKNSSSGAGRGCAAKLFGLAPMDAGLIRLRQVRRKAMATAEGLPSDSHPLRCSPTARAVCGSAPREGRAAQRR